MIIIPKVVKSLWFICHRPNGGIAQLVERLLCKQDVCGSSPHISIFKRLSLNTAYTVEVIR